MNIYENLLGFMNIYEIENLRTSMNISGNLSQFLKICESYENLRESKKIYKHL